MLPDILAGMGWISDDNLHEGYLAALFEDGQRGAGVTGGGIPADRIAIGTAVQRPDGSWEYPTRPAGEVTAWVICCNCSSPSSLRRIRTWTGPVFARVPSQALESIAAGRIFAVDADVADVAERDDVETAARNLWTSEHVFATDALGEIEAASGALTAAKSRLDVAVLLARGAGASWEAVGRAAGMTRQAAHGRWGAE